MTESIPDEASRLEEFPKEKVISKKKGMDSGGRVFSLTEISSHLETIEQILGQIGESKESEEERKAVLLRLKPHLHIVKKFLNIPVPQGRTDVKPGEEDEIDRERMHAVLSMVAQARRALAFKQLEAALQQAQQSDNPLETVRSAYETIERICAEDPSLRPFLLAARRLMVALQGKPDEIKRLLIPLFHKVFLESPALGGFTSLEGSRCAARLLFAIDHHLLDELRGPFDSVQKNLEAIVKKKVDELAREYEIQKEKMISSGLYSPDACRASYLPQAIAKTLVRSDGTLNLGILDIITKSSFFHSKEERDHVERHLVSLLHEMQSDPALRQMLEDMPVPMGDDGRGTVNAILLRQYGCPVSAADTHVAALASLCTWWRQGNVGNCFIVSVGIQRQQTTSKWLFEDIQDLLLRDGVLTREVDGRPINFYGLPCPKNMAMDAPISHEKANELFELPPIRNACHELGVTTTEEFSAGIKSLLLKQPTLTLGAIFEELRKIHGRSEADLLRASWIAESPGQNLLLCQWENAVGGMHLLPASATSFPTHVSYSSSCFLGIVRVMSTAASVVNAKGFQSVLDAASSVLSQPTDKATAVPPGMIPPSLLRLRCIQIPQIPPQTQPSLVKGSDERTLSWMVGTEVDGQFVPFKDQKEFETFLRDLFIEWAESHGEKVSDAQRAELTEVISNVLQKQTFFMRGGTQYGALCYTFKGGGDFPLLEQSRVSFSSPVAMSIVPFAKSEPFAKTVPALSADDRRKTIQNFFSLLVKYGIRPGTGPGISMVSDIPGHRMTVLDLPPEPLGREGDPVEIREELAKAAVAETRLTPGVYTAHISGPLNAFAAMLAEKCGVSKEEILHEILAKIQSRYPTITTVSIKAFLEGVWEILAEEYTLRTSDPSAPEDCQTQFFLSSLTKLIPGYKRHFIHFSDTNWYVVVGDKREAMHGCFWFDPIHEQWEIVSLSESGEVVPKTTTQPFFGLANALSVFSLSRSMSEQFRQKKLLELDRKTISTLQKTEREFINSWHTLEQETKKLTPEELERLHEQQTLHLDRAPPQWKKAFEACASLRNKYYTALKKRMVEEASAGDTLRYSHLWSSDRSFHLLTCTEEQFQLAVIDVLSPPLDR